MSYAYILGSVVFGTIAVLHLIRVFTGTEIEIGETEVPRWVSLVIFFVGGTLSAWLLRVGISRKR